MVRGSSVAYKAGELMDARQAQVAYTCSGAAFTAVTGPAAGLVMELRLPALHRPLTYLRCTQNRTICRAPQEVSDWRLTALAQSDPAHCSSAC